MDYSPCAENPLLCEGASAKFQDCALQTLDQDRYAILITGIEKPTENDIVLFQPCLDQFGADLKLNPDEKSGPPPFMRPLSVADWENIIGMLIPADELKVMTEETLDQVSGYLSSKQDTASISLVNLKNHVASQAGVDAILKIIRAHAPCTPEQTAQMMTVLEGAEGEMLLLPPADETLVTMTPLIQVQLANYATSLPDEKVLLSPETGENSNSPMGNLGGQTRLLHFLLRVSPDLPLLFLLLVTLFAVRSPKSWLRWWGIPFFVTGLFSFGMAVTAASTFEQAWLTLFARKIPPSISLGVVTLAHDLLHAVSQSLLTGIRVSAFLLGLLGRAIWVGSYFIKLNPAPEPPPEPVV